MDSIIESLVSWLSATAFSGFLDRVHWIIPLLQTVHLVCVSVVMSSVLFMGLHILGIFATQESVTSMRHRFLPWTWSALATLLLTGVILVIAEPGRELNNPTFRLKMILIAVSVLILGLGHRPFRAHDSDAITHRQRPVLERIIVAVSLLLWIGILIAGRMIAYDAAAQS
jgi:hypothetical protein